MSELAGDADMMGMVGFFIGQLHDRVGALRQAWEKEDRAALRRLASQLKGAAGGCGFPGISRTAAEVEREVLATESDAARLGEELESLISLCRRAAAGWNGSERSPRLSASA